VQSLHRLRARGGPVSAKSRRFRPRPALDQSTVAASPASQPRRQNQRGGGKSGLAAIGKHKKIALIACIIKIVTALNSMIRDNTPWNAAAT
jgi:hypothetical protein